MRTVMRYVRAHEHHPGASHAPPLAWYTATVVATIALSIALASTVFAVVDGVLFKPLPYPEAHPPLFGNGKHWYRWWRERIARGRGYQVAERG
jgi:hypothetical protein